MNFETRSQKRHVIERMDAVILPLLDYFDKDTKECFEIGMRILRDTDVEPKRFFNESPIATSLKVISSNREKLEYDFKEFEADGYCDRCGSQRCERNLEWATACNRFIKWVEEHPLPSAGDMK